MKYVFYDVGRDLRTFVKNHTSNELYIFTDFLKTVLEDTTYEFRGRYIYSNKWEIVSTTSNKFSLEYYGGRIFLFVFEGINKFEVDTSHPFMIAVKQDVATGAGCIIV